MSITYDRKAVADAVRVPVFGGHLYQNQVEGIDAILSEWELAYPNGDTRFIAYILATPAWETAHAMRPIKEHGTTAYFTEMYDIRGRRPSVARALGNTEPGDGARFPGRGLAQTTGRKNYAWASTVIGQDCVADPDLLLKPEWACKVIFAAMIGGKYTGKKLADYFGGDKADWVGARRIINGLDQAATIAGYGKAFYAGLKAGRSDAAPIAAAPTTLSPAKVAASAPIKVPAHISLEPVAAPANETRVASSAPEPASTPEPGIISRIASLFG